MYIVHIPIDIYAKYLTYFKLFTKRRKEERESNLEDSFYLQRI